MSTIPLVVRVRGEITIPVNQIPPMALAQIKSALTIPNEAREKASSIKQFGWWDLPETIALWRIEQRRGGEEVLCLPRGFAGALSAGLAGMGISMQWDDQRTRVPAAPGYFKIFYVEDRRDYQLDAAVALLRFEQGIWKAPAGAGKTVGSLLAMAYAGQRTIVIVDKIGLANQWRVRAHQFYDMPLEEITNEHGIKELVAPLEGNRTVGLIGNDVWEERDLTICLRQTLHARAWQLAATHWWETWGFTFHDEVHHVVGETLADISRNTTSAIVGGASATPFKSPAKKAIVEALIGPIVHETPRQILYERRVLMKPVVEVLKGDFYTHFHPDHDAEFDKETQNWKCQMHGCKKSARHSHRNNYSTVLKNLKADKARNKRIAQRIVAERGHIHLVPSAHLNLLTTLQKALIAEGWPEDKIWFLRGEENAKGLDQLIAQSVHEADEGIILSTVAGEALDIPPIDRVHIVFPMRDQSATIQLVGRAERVYQRAGYEKVDAIVIDYREPLVEVLEGQYGERDRTYRMQGYDIVESRFSVVVESEQEAENAAG